MNVRSNGHEHEFEPQHGLPERLPPDEHILWQGAPALGAVMRRVFHLRLLAIYFGLMLALRAGNVLPGAASWREGLALMAGPVLLSVAALLTLAALAWLTCRSTAYTLTNRRVVMRIGIVLTLSFNLPLRSIQSADLKLTDGECGDIALALAGSDRIAWFHLWPHVRPWRLTQPQPTLRALPDARRVSGLLSQAWSQANGMTAQPLPGQASDPSSARHLEPSLT